MRPAVMARWIATGFLAVAMGVTAWMATTQWLVDSPPQPSVIDIGFTQAMAVHHRQAIAMAQIMLDAPDTPLHPLARQIAYGQLLELGEMQGWLRLWQASLHPHPVRMDWMLAAPTPPDAELRRYLLDCERAPQGMPGLATTEQLTDLRASVGRERDRQFLELMLAHHRGGLPMARFAAEHARLHVVRALAQNIVLEQSHEIERMRRTLIAMDASPASQPQAAPPSDTDAQPATQP